MTARRRKTGSASPLPAPASSTTIRERISRGERVLALVREGLPGLRRRMPLVRRPDGVERWNGPYVRKLSQLQDPWGNDLVMQRPGENGPFDIISYGSDGQPGGEGDDADITSWE